MEPPAEAVIEKSILCARCGEPTQASRTVEVDGKVPVPSPARPRWAHESPGAPAIRGGHAQKDAPHRLSLLWAAAANP